MAVPPNQGRPQGATPRRALTRAEAATLAGMLLCIASLFLAWPAPNIGKLIAPALVVNLAGAGAPSEDVRYPVTGGAILAGLIIAISHSPSTRVPLAFVQALCGIVCFTIALLHFRVIPGPMVDLAGGALITLGAVDRIGQSAGHAA